MEKRKNYDKFGGWMLIFLVWMTINVVMVIQSIIQFIPFLTLMGVSILANFLLQILFVISGVLAASCLLGRNRKFSQWLFIWVVVNAGMRVWSMVSLLQLGLSPVWQMIFLVAGLGWLLYFRRSKRAQVWMAGGQAAATAHADALQPVPTQDDACQSLGNTFSGGDAVVMAQIEGYLAGPEAYYAAHREGLARWGIAGEQPQRAALHWAILCDVLEGQGFARTVAREAAAEEPLMAVEALLARQGIMGVGLHGIERTTALGEALRPLSLELRAHGYALCALDLRQGFCLAIAPLGQLDAICDLAGMLGRRIVVEFV